MYRKIAMVVIAVVISNFGVIVQVYIFIDYLGSRCIFTLDCVLVFKSEKRTFSSSCT